LHHGGLGSLGVNIVVVALPAFLAGAFFRLYVHVHGKRGLFWSGAILSFMAVELTVTLDYVALRFGAVPEVEGVAALIWIAHLPVAIAEGILGGFSVDFLARVRPDWLWLTPESAPPAAPPTAPSPR
jgi:cobalt/nickel transport system permease protein